jgi:hypothetical protein
MFSVGEMAYIHNATIAVPQIQCTSPSYICNEARVTTIGCRNMGFNADKKVVWRCETNSINRGVKSTNITCEKIDPTSYIAVKHSCYIQYKLQGGIFDDEAARVVFILAAMFLLLVVFVACCSDDNHRRHRTRYYSGCDPYCVAFMCMHTATSSVTSVTFSTT